MADHTLRAYELRRQEVELIYPLLLLFGFASAIAQRSLDPLTITIAPDLATAPETVALLASAAAVPFALAQPVLGPMGDHFGKERVIKGALWLLAFSVFFSAFVPIFAMLMALRVVTGAASGGIIPISQAILGDLYTGHRRQVCIARVTMAAFVGQLAGASFAGLVVGWIGWRGVLLASSAVVFASAMLATMKIPNSPARPKGEFSIRAILRNYRALFRLPRAWACYLTGFLQSGTIFGLLPFIAYILEGQKNGGPREAGLIIAGYCLGSLAYALGASYILRRLTRPQMLITGAVIAGLSLIAFGQGYHWSSQIGIFAVVGFGFFLQHNAIQGEVSDLSEDLRASAYSMHAFAFCVGAAAAPVVYGLAFPAVGAGTALTVAGLLFLCTGIVSGSLFIWFRRVGI